MQFNLVTNEIEGFKCPNCKKTVIVSIECIKFAVGTLGIDITCLQCGQSYTMVFSPAMIIKKKRNN